MCGIAGVISLNGSEPHHGLIFSMTRSIAHRGPDGEGFLIAGGRDSAFSDKSLRIHHATSKRPIHFGHRRLSIVDLSSDAAQPMTDVSGRYWITFNGEIYNHREIRSDLEKKGCRFRTHHSDTEVILEAYKTWGFDCLKKFRGMFAFALWDSEQDLVWLVRDRFGKKPLYYSHRNGSFLFASEIKAILCSPDISFEMDFQALSDYLSFTFVPPPATLFKGINKLAAGHQLVIRDGHVSTPQPYYNIFENVKVDHGMRSDEAIEGFRSKFMEAVNYRRESDVPYGAYLSGGVDSSAIVGALTALTGKRIHTFSVGYSSSIRDYQSELNYASKVARHFNTIHHEKVVLDEEIGAAIPELTWYMDEPISDSACIPLYMLSKLARENGVTVCLGGEGSDETFIGYELWRFMYDFMKLNQMFPPLQPLFRSLSNLEMVRSHRPFYSEWANRLKSGRPVFMGGIEYMNEAEKSRLFKPGFAESMKLEPAYRIIEQLNKRYETESGGRDILNRMTYIDLNLRLPELLLARLDKMSMAAGVEARAPFMDHELVEFSMSIPAGIKLKGNTEKYVVKKGVEPMLPHDIIYRKKEGFMMPTEHFLGKNLAGYMKERITRFTKEYDFISDAYLRSLIDVNDPSKTWYFLNLSVWWEQFIQE